jgi:SpoVK/Ycf46/Vps4 family AAA+-type ATPase
MSYVNGGAVMILYKFELKYESKNEQDNNKETLNPKVDGKNMKDIICGVNELMGTGCGLEGKLSMQVVGGKQGELRLVMACDEGISLKEGLKWIREHFKENYAVKVKELSGSEEITVKEFLSLIERGECQSYGTRSWEYKNLGLDYLENSNFRVQEELHDVKKLTKAAALTKARRLMADKTLIEEIERIYSDENGKNYCGNPVHYRINAGNDGAAKAIIELLVQALASNNRLLGKRLSYIYNITEYCYAEPDLENLFRTAEGEALAIDMSESAADRGNLASPCHEVVWFFKELINKYQLYTLCFFVNIYDNPGFSANLIAEVSEDIHIIDIREGKGDREASAEYLRDLAESRKFEITEEELESALTKKSGYTASQLHEIYDKFFGNALKNRVYRAYAMSKRVEMQKVEGVKAYDELKNMVGLSQIKELTDQIICTAKMNKTRKMLGMNDCKMSQHMVFTGNPGSAKTTVARLLAEILRNEGVLESGVFIECGRADLVEQYVGWTAKNVVKKFRAAKGGILFIDEAYALVDEKNSFGEEAINTIVQEMENHREDVIVIFAGYPDKMEKFLAQNEGLRSRIAFNLKFPDYNADEMVEIFELMAKSKGYSINAEMKTKCREIFAKACKEPEFGNGRFARNLLEKVIMKQSERLVKTYTGKSSKKLSKKVVTTLKIEDFDVDMDNAGKPEKPAIGFLAGCGKIVLGVL